MRRCYGQSWHEESGQAADIRIRNENKAQTCSTRIDAVYRTLQRQPPPDTISRCLDSDSRGYPMSSQCLT